MPDLALRLELFPSDLDACADFYTRVLRFRLERDERDAPVPYLALRRGTVRIGARTAWSETDSAHRRPPHGVEVVLEVDDLEEERAAVLAEGAVLVEDLVERPWGLRDFRLCDPDGTYLRVTSR